MCRSALRGVYGVQARQPADALQDDAEEVAGGRAVGRPPAEVQPPCQQRTRGLLGTCVVHLLAGWSGEPLKSPERLTHTWEDPEHPNVVSTVDYSLERTEAGTRITLRHEGVHPELVCANTCAGWETSFARLNEMLAGASL
jgi:hypothetical protein